MSWFKRWSIKRKASKDSHDSIDPVTQTKVWKNFNLPPRTKKELSKQKSMNKRWVSRMFGKSTIYQNKVNALTGAMGPQQPAFWKNNYKLTGPAYSLGAQPLYYAPRQGFYVTSADIPAAQGSVNFSDFRGFGRRRRNRRSHKGSRKRSRRNRKSLRKRSRRSRRGSRRNRK